MLTTSVEKLPRTRTWDEELIKKDEENRDVFNKKFRNLIGNFNLNQTGTLKDAAYNFLGQYKNQELENEFVKFYSGESLVRLRFCVWFLYVMVITYYGIDVFLYWQDEYLSFWYFLYSCISRFFVVILVAPLNISLHFKSVRKNRVLREIIEVCLFLSFYVPLMFVGFFSYRKGTFPIGGTRIVITLMVGYLVTRSPLHIIFIVTVITFACFTVTIFVVYFAQHGWIILMQVLNLLVCLSVSVAQVYLIERTFRRLFMKRKMMDQIKKMVENEKKRKTEMLNNIFPQFFVEKFTSLDTSNHNDRFFSTQESLSVILTDLVDFTGSSSKVQSTDLVKIMNIQTTNFDILTESFGLEKIKTIGDAYYCCDLYDKGTLNCVLFANNLIGSLKELNAKHEWDFQMRIGIAKGNANIVCLGKKLSFDIYGSIVEEVSFLESHSEPNRILCSERIKDETGKSVKYLLSEQIEREFGIRAYFVEVIAQNPIEMIKSGSSMVFKKDFFDDNFSGKLMIRKIKGVNRKTSYKKKKANKKYLVQQNGSFSTNSIISERQVENLYSINKFFLGFNNDKNLKKNWEYTKHNEKEGAHLLHVIFILSTTYLIVIAFSNVFYLTTQDFGTWGHFYKLIPMLVFTLLSAIVSSIYLLANCLSKSVKFFKNLPLYTSRMMSWIQIIVLSLFLFSILLLKKDMMIYTASDEVVAIIILNLHFFFFNTPFWPTVAFSTIVSIIFITLDTIFFKFLIESTSMQLLVIVVQCIMIYPLRYNLLKIFRTELILKSKIKTLNEELQKDEDILYSSLPSFVVNRLVAKQSCASGDNNLSKLDSSAFFKCDHFKNGSVLFIKIVNLDFSKRELSVDVLVQILNEIFVLFDDIIDEYNCIKIKSIYLTYIAIHPNDFGKLLNCAFKILERSQIIFRRENKGNTNFGIKMGIVNGDFVGGIVGLQKFLYDIFGDIVNVASRMCDLSEKTKILCSTDRNFLEKQSHRTNFNYLQRGKIDVKGKGSLEAFWIEKKKE